MEGESPVPPWLWGLSFISSLSTGRTSLHTTSLKQLQGGRGGGTFTQSRENECQIKCMSRDSLYKRQPHDSYREEGSFHFHNKSLSLHSLHKLKHILKYFSCLLLCQLSLWNTGQSPRWHVYVASCQLYLSIGPKKNQRFLVYGQESGSRET